MNPLEMNPPLGNLEVGVEAGLLIPTIPEPTHVNMLEQSLQQLEEFVAKSFSKSFSAITTEIQGSSHVVTSPQPFFRPEQSASSSVYNTAARSLLMFTSLPVLSRITVIQLNKPPKSVESKDPIEH